MQVQGKSGKFYDVDVNTGVCSCSGYQARGRCPHSKLTLDVFRKEGKLFSDELKSAFAADFRGVNKEAYNWARLIAKARGNEYFISFCRDLIRTETRNLSALEASYKTDAPAEIVHLLFSSSRTYENPYFVNAVPAMHEALSLYRALKEYKNYATTRAYLRKLIDQAETITDAYVVMFFVEANPDIKKSFVRMLYDRAEDDQNWELLRFLECEDIHSSISIRWACELMVRFWHPMAEGQRVGLEAPGFYVPSLGPRHVTLKALKEIMGKNAPRINPNKKIANDVGLDLRYSDSYLGVYWRYLAVQQKNSIDVPWEEVKFFKEDWASAGALDRHYHPQVYRAADRLAVTVE